ncbi:MAG: hypothetical protein KAG98_00215 [Lentisphaeria bacterium]|nr:hypothetical protein [Lentisphaeria bacterium]
MGQLLKICCVVLISFCATGCPSGTYGLPTPRRLGHFFTSQEVDHAPKENTAVCENESLVEEQVVLNELAGK